jgi:hypothetical protein
MYKIFKRLGNGEFIQIGSRDTLEQALKVVEGLNAIWPGKYVVQDAEGNDVRGTEKPV